MDTVEALAILRGLQLIFHMGIKHIIIESDSQTIINRKNLANMGLARQQALLSEIKNRFSVFEDCKFGYIGREANEIILNNVN